MNLFAEICLRKNGVKEAAKTHLEAAKTHLEAAEAAAEKALTAAAEAELERDRSEAPWWSL